MNCLQKSQEKLPASKKHHIDILSAKIIPQDDDIPNSIDPYINTKNVLARQGAITELSNYEKGFRPGRYYRRLGGHYISILGELSTTFSGDVLIAETNNGKIISVGKNPEDMKNYFEISYDEWKKSIEKKIYKTSK